jgi:hypothetical protein
VVLVPVTVLVFGGAPAAAATAAAGSLPANAADVDEQCVVVTKEKRQVLGYRLLSDAIPAVDVYQRCGGGLHRPAEDIRSRDRGGEGRTTTGSVAHWYDSVLSVRVAVLMGWLSFDIAFTEIVV